MAAPPSPLSTASGADLVLLDLMLPGLAGTEVCRELRARSSVPIIMLTAKDSEVDIVVGLELGADDYVTKPYSTRELLARIRAVLRRRTDLESDDGGVVEVGAVRMDVERHSVTVDGREVAMPLKEFELLELLAAQRGARADPRPVDRPGLGRRLLRRHQDPRRAHQAHPVEDRGHAVGTDPTRDRARARLPLRGVAQLRSRGRFGGRRLVDRFGVASGWGSAGRPVVLSSAAVEHREP